MECKSSKSLKDLLLLEVKVDDSLNFVRSVRRRRRPKTVVSLLNQ